MEKLTYRQQMQVLAEMQAKLNALDELVLGAIALLGREEVLQAAQDFRAEERRKVDEALAAEVERGVKDGWLIPTTVSGLKSLVVGEETLSTGVKTRLQAIPSAIPPQHRGQYIGRQVGEEFVGEGPSGKFPTKITGVYEIDEERRQQVVAEAAAAAKAKAAGAAEAPPPAPSDPA